MTTRVKRYLALTAAAWGTRLQWYKPPKAWVDGCLEEKDRLWAEMSAAERQVVYDRVMEVVRRQGVL